MWDILRLPHWHVRVSLFLEDKDEMIRRMNIIRYLCRLTCASWIPCLRKSGCEIGWALVFEIRFSVDMVLVAPVGSPLGYSIIMLIVLALDNYFGTWEGYLFGVSLVTLADLMIGTV